ncbi:MAG: hypothetical protein F4091_07010 [Acidimicrobiales bacterium]|nr:hypothetical protein [Acidimicrobiales bacterium]MYJ65197.1 hypothetical protein [Acidimicrobiales bacterium]
MTRTPDSDLRQELARSRAIRIRPGLTRPEDPREFGRRVARETFERYVKSRERAEDTDKL